MKKESKRHGTLISKSKKRLQKINKGKKRV